MGRHETAEEGLSVAGGREGESRLQHWRVTDARSVMGRQMGWVVGPAGIEPATAGLEIRCSILLSYGPSWKANLLWPILAQPVRHKRR